MTLFTIMSQAAFDYFTDISVCVWEDEKAHGGKEREKKKAGMKRLPYKLE